MRGVERPHRSGEAGRAAGLSRYAAEGFLGPVPLLSRGERTLLLDHLASDKTVEPVSWRKGHAVGDRLFYDIASNRRILDLLRPILGENIILWGTRIVRRRPGQAHAWHVDIESAAAGQRFASVWIGVAKTSRESGLAVVSRSHRFARTLLDVQPALCAPTDDAILALARAQDPLAELLQPEITDGEALIFDGRLWHGTLNRRPAGTRTALLLQYASADAPVFMPDPAQVEGPFRLTTEERPPVILVSGEGNGGGNRQVAPPAPGRRKASPVATQALPIALPLERDPQKGWRPHPLFRGPTAIHGALGCHVSVLDPGVMPHPPHAHIEEELLIVLDGAAELLIGDSPDVDAATAHPVGAGTFAYYPAFRHHTLRNVGAGPLSYLMFKWRGAPVAVESPLAMRIVDTAHRPPKESKPRQTWKLLEGPTNFLAKLHVHVSDAAPGGGHDLHSDPYDVAIVVLAGTVETVGRTVGPFGVAFYAAGEPHALRNVGLDRALYLVVEFHGEAAAPRTSVAKARPGARRPKPKPKRKRSVITRLRKRVIAALRRAYRSIMPE